MEKQLPKNWVLLPFTEIFDINGGTQPPKAVFIDEPKEGYIRLLQIRDFGKKPVPTYIPDTGKLMTCKKDDILIARYGASIGRIVTGMAGSYNVALAKVSVPENMNKNFVKWLLKSNLFQEPILSIQRTAQNGFNKTDLAAIYVPLPPLPEQHRIVTKLDTLFAQLETIKTSMANIPLLLKDFRQQVLTQAVTGKLTENTNNQVASCPSTITIGNVFTHTPDNWKWEKLIDIAKLESGHTPRKSEIEYWINGDIPWISLQDIRAAHGKIISETKYMPNELGIKKSSARLLPKGTVCFCRDISVGYTTVMGKEMSTTQHFANWICGKSLNNMFLLYAFMAAKDFLIASGKGTTVGTIYMPALKELRILLPPLEEQQKIVNRVESLFAKADAIEQQYKTLKASIDNVPQAILHKAFKGELSEQLASDGDARQLLNEIKALKAATGKVIKSKTNKKAAEKVKPYSETEEVLGMVAESKE
nr:restriction endonuclease subunit S [uncultured Flavobacterium sp.]